jgi:hypothetical protein
VAGKNRMQRVKEVIRANARKACPDVTVVSYYTTPWMTLAFVLTKDSFHVKNIPVTEPELSLARGDAVGLLGRARTVELRMGIIT